MPSLNSRLVFLVLLISHSIAALQSPIQDCDETFNFWEPSHYLNHGYGLQTWELSPKYAIRSWLYSTLHSVPIYLLSFLGPSTSKSTDFYRLRLSLGFVAAVCETRLFSAISRSMNRRVALIYFVICASSAGMFHATVSYLPSSFAMYTTALALADFMEVQAGVPISRGVTWLGFGSTVGWPFVAVLSFPFVLQELVLSFLHGTSIEVLQRLGDGVVQSLLILIFQISIDSFFYHKVTSVPFNIVRYNVLSRSGKGPNIYGTEPWHFYIRNLLINFNLWFILACISLPLVLLYGTFGSRSLARTSLSRTTVLLSPFYLWFLIFTLQPHKEERFMYPIYPCIALNAAISLHILVLGFGSSSQKSLIRYVPTRLWLAVIASAVFSAIALGFWRIAGLSTAYSAPLTIYRGLHTDPMVTGNPDTIIRVCIGKEWYRFPSSYHIPPNARLSFIKSEFNGLLPGAFSEVGPSDSDGDSGVFPGAWLVPQGMNDENIGDPGKYTELERCDFLVDSSFPGRELSEREPDFVNMEESWEKVECMQFLDVERTGILGRLFWIPEASFVPSKWRRKWGDYCLLKSRRHS